MQRKLWVLYYFVIHLYNIGKMTKVNTGGQKKCKHTHTQRKKKAAENSLRQRELSRHVGPTEPDFCMG